VRAIEAWRRRYWRAGIATLPLPSFSKAASYDFTSVAPAEAWLDYGGQAGNIGILLGGGLAAFDCDDTVAAATVGAWAAGLGLDLASVRSATPGHQHIYIRCGDIPEGLNVRALATGAGDFRARRSLLVAPCSAVYVAGELRRYKWATASGPERLMGGQLIKWRDIEPMLSRPAAGPAELLDALPVRLVWRPARRAQGWLRMLAGAPKGEPVLGWPTRSEAEASAVCSMAISGWDFDAVARTFAEMQPGHYRDAGKYGKRYLWRTWQTACTYLAAQGERPAIAASYHAASSAAWPGRSGAYDRAVYLAALAIAWQAGSWQVAASVRDVAQHAAIGVKTASYALRRLRLDYGLLEQARDAEHGPYHAHTFRVSPFVPKGNTSHSLEPFLGLNTEGTTSRCSSSSSSSSSRPAAEQELWAWARLGKSAGMVYGHLRDNPQTVAELATATGKGRRTIYRALATLQVYGLADDAGHGWRLGPVSLAEAAAAFDCELAARRRAQGYECEREAWRGYMLGYGPVVCSDDAQIDAVAFAAVLGDDWRGGDDDS